MDMESLVRKNPKILCLHGHSESGAIMKEGVLSVWPESVVGEVDLIFIDAPIPVLDQHGNYYDPPRFKWFQANFQSLPKYEIEMFDECIQYVEDCMAKLSPFDGVMGFSQGAYLAATLPGMQTQGVALTKVEKIKFVIVISGGKLGGSVFCAPKLAENAFSWVIQCPSLHIMGDKDIAKPYAIELLSSFLDPFVIYHHQAHVIPKLDEESMKVMFNFIHKIKNGAVNTVLLLLFGALFMMLFVSLKMFSSVSIQKMESQRDCINSTLHIII